MANVLYLDSFLKGSHLNFYNGLLKHSKHNWQSKSIPNAPWKWTSRFSGYLLAEQLPDINNFDLIIASDYVDLCQLISFLPRNIELPSIILYMHENQLSYPLYGDEKRDLQYGISNLLSMKLATEIWFNSHWHQLDWQSSVDQLTKKIPWGPKEKWYVQKDKRRVVYPGVNIEREESKRSVCANHKCGPKTILWNHRWEFDKNPDFFLKLLADIEKEDIDYQLVICGQGSIKAKDHPLWQSNFTKRLTHLGEIKSREEYLNVLEQSDIIFSSSLHEFFGISIVEGILKKCLPILPNRLTYPELIPTQFHDKYLYQDLEGAKHKILSLLKMDADSATQASKNLRSELSHFDWNNRINEFDEKISNIIQL